MYQGMKILHVIPSLAAETGGTAVSVLKICEAQAQAGADLTLYTTFWPHLGNSGDGMILKSMEKAGVKARIFPTKVAPLNLPLPHSPQLVEAVRDSGREFDFIVNHSLWNPIATGCMNTLRKMELNYALMPHGMLDPVVFTRHRSRKKLWAWAWERSNVEGASLILFNTQAEEEKARRCGWELKQTFIFPHLVDLAYWKELPQPSLFEAKFPSLQNREVILFVGRLNWVKNLDRLVEAFAMVHARRPASALVLVGPGIDGAQSQLETQAEKLGVKEDLLFTGLLGAEDLKAAYARGQVFALVSQKENFGLAAAEALAAGLPVVISKGVDLGRNWESCGPVRRITPDPEPIAEAILDLLERAATVGLPDPEAWALAEKTWGNSHSSMQQLLETFQKIIEAPSCQTRARSRVSGLRIHESKKAVASCRFPVARHPQHPALSTQHPSSSGLRSAVSGQQMDKLPITVLIAAKNEEKNIGRCLSSLSPAARVILIDSQSQDRTESIARDCGAEVIQFHYRGGYPKKRQWALDSISIHTPWVFLLDADEAVPDALWGEVADAVNQSGSADAYLITKGFHFMGRRFRHGGFSHKALVLFRRDRGRFEEIIDEDPSGLDMEVHERVLVEGRIGRLKTPLIHEDFKGLEAYISRHNQYSSWEAKVREKLLKGRNGNGSAIRPRLFGDHQERRRFLKMIAMRVPFEPQLWFFYHYFLRLGFLEGKPGLISSRIRSDYIVQVRAKLYELRLLASGSPQGG